MENEKRVLPLVVTTSGGMSGSSPAVSMIGPAGLVNASEGAERLPEARDNNAIASPDNTVEFQNGICCAADDTLGDQTWTFNEVLAEITRQNVEHAMELAKNLSRASNPADALALQKNYLVFQANAFAGQLQVISRAFWGASASSSLQQHRGATGVADPLLKR